MNDDIRWIDKKLDLFIQILLYFFYLIYLKHEMLNFNKVSCCYVQIMHMLKNQQFKLRKITINMCERRCFIISSWLNIKNHLVNCDKNRKNTVFLRLLAPIWPSFPTYLLKKQTNLQTLLCRLKGNH